MNRSGLYYEKKPITENVVFMNEIHDIYSEWPFYGYRKIHAVLRMRGYKANRKKVQRLMQLIGLRAVWILNGHRKKIIVIVHSYCA